MKDAFQQWKSNTVLRISSAISVTESGNIQILFRQIIAFAAVGAIAGVLDYLVMILLREALSIDAVISALVGYAFGSTTSYTLNRLKTFRSVRPHREAVWRFATVIAIGFGTTGVLMSVMVNAMHINYMISRVFTMIAISLMNFLAYKFWTFSTVDAQNRWRA